MIGAPVQNRRRGELDFGLRLEPQKTLTTLEAFESRWRAESAAVAVMEPDTYALLQRESLPMVLRARDPQRLLVSRQ